MDVHNSIVGERESERERGAMQGRGGATTTLVFIFIPTSLPRLQAVSPNPCFYLLLIDPLARPSEQQQQQRERLSPQSKVESQNIKIAANKHDSSLHCTTIC